MNDYKNVITSLDFLNHIATILIARDFLGIIEHLPLRGHIFRSNESRNVYTRDPKDFN
jgi:hypothetical protein